MLLGSWISIGFDQCIEDSCSGRLNLSYSTRLWRSDPSRASELGSRCLEILAARSHECLANGCSEEMSGNIAVVIDRSVVAVVLLFIVVTDSDGGGLDSAGVASG